MKYLKSLTLKMCVIAAALLLASPAVAVNSNGRGTKVKTVYQDTDPSATNYLKNRRALVGPGCTVNSVGDGVKVLSGLKDPQNLCNDNLDDYASFPGLVDATVAASPVVSIKDNKHYYAKGTEAGFTICTSSDAGILKVDVSTLYGIRFFKDGKAVSDVVAVKTGQNITGLGLSLLTIPGSNLVTKSFVAEAPADFDEVQLYRMGVEANVGGVLNIKYAFVGKAREYTVTNNKKNGIQNYVKDYNRKTITLSGDEKLYDEDLTNSVFNNIGSVEVRATPTDGKEVFPAGTEIGFKYKVKDGLSLGLGAYTKITLYSKDYKTDLLGFKHDIETENHTVNVDVLNLGVIKDKEDAEVVIKSTKPFSKAKLTFGGVKLEVGATTVNYAFVRMAPDAASHHCPINATSSRDVSGSVNQFQLQHNKNVDVTWSVQSHPEGAADVELVSTSGLVSNLSLPGKYVFRATAADGCYEETTLNYAPTYIPEEHGVNILVNKEGEKPKYALSDKLGGGLIQIFDRMMNRSAILTTSLNDFAYREPGVEVAANTGLVGIKTADGSNFADGLNGNARAFNGKMKVGFVVSVKTTGLDADVLNLYNIKLYNKGLSLIHI